MVGGVLMITEGSCQVIWSIYLRFISQDTFYFVYYALAMSIVASIMTFFIPESPRYLYGANDLKGCSDVLQLIARRNNVIGYDLPKFEPEYEKAMKEMKGKNVKFGAVDVMKNKDLAILAKIRRAPTIYVYGNDKFDAV